jgi:transcriptional regulator with XRE-family HTH domain
MKRTTAGIKLPTLRALREGRNLSRRAVAEAIRIDQATLYRLETGKTGASAQTVTDLASFFGTSIEALQKNMH